MLRSLVTGILHADPVRRTSAGGTEFVTAKLKDDSETPPQWFSVVAFAGMAETLAKLTKGETIAVAGKMFLKTYEAKDGSVRIDANLVADQIATLRRKRKPAGAAPEHREGRQDEQQERYFDADEPF